MRVPSVVWDQENSRSSELSSDCKIVVLTLYADDDLMTAALQAGAQAYVLKSEIAGSLIPAIQATPVADIDCASEPSGDSLMRF